MKTIIPIFSVIVFILISCQKEEHFITDTNYRKKVLADFEKTKDLAKERADVLFGVFNQNLGLKEEEALKFLYAYMPLNDLADYNGDFFLHMVKLAFEAKETFSWGKNIPEDLFRHYVLPCRVNNENLDSARAVFYKELKDRLKGLSLEEAALEINRWCHEKVVYQPTDERTISPLNAVKSAYGRCGEQSTFTVTAMRAACIPARQCYTPRWAHTDDNHAWVEVWINGKWRYLGACEPEVKLDVAWFSEPVQRAMLVHSKVYGQYKGTEKVDRQFNKYAYMNLLEHYTPVKELFVRVLDRNGQPIQDADVEYQLYNYAEFYPISTQKTDKNGLSKFTTGFGDLMIWAHYQTAYAYQKISVESVDTVNLFLGKIYTLPYTEQFLLIPPVKRELKSTLTKEENELNNACKITEDSIRNNFVSTFISEKQAIELADKLKLDRKKVWEYLQLSRGNYPEIVSYLEEAVKILPAYTIKLLDVISKKDSRDATAKILTGNLANSAEFETMFEDKEFFANYVLNPRVANEKLTDAKTYLAAKFKNTGINDPNQLIEWIRKELTVDADNNYYLVPMTPSGVYELKITDSFSRDIFFVLACRSIGIAARLEPGTNIPQYYHNNSWHDAVFEMKNDLKREKGSIVLIKDKKMKIDPLYRIHFSLMRLQNGRYNTLDYEWEKPLSKMGNSFTVDTGQYMLLTGNRQQDGSVLAQMSFFRVEADKSTDVHLQLNKQLNKIKALASYAGPIGFRNLKGGSMEINTGEPVVLAWLDVNMEPSKHALNDIQQLNNELNASGIHFYFIVHELNPSNRDLLKTYRLPVNSKLLVDPGYESLGKMKSSTGLKSTNYPVILFLDKNDIYYYSTGYNIGVGEQLLKLSRELQEK